VACPIKISSSSLLVVFEGRRRRAIDGGVRVERWCDAAVVHRRIIADAGSELGVGVVGERRRLEIKEVGAATGSAAGGNGGGGAGRCGGS
jgi:hypothetical protein